MGCFYAAHAGLLILLSAGTTGMDYHAQFLLGF